MKFMMATALFLLLIDVALALAWHGLDRSYPRALLFCALGGGAAYLLAGLLTGFLWLDPLLALGAFPAAAVAAALAALIGIPFLLTRRRVGAAPALNTNKGRP